MPAADLLLSQHQRRDHAARHRRQGPRQRRDRRGRVRPHRLPHRGGRPADLDRAGRCAPIPAATRSPPRTWPAARNTPSTSATGRPVRTRGTADFAFSPPAGATKVDPRQAVGPRRTSPAVHARRREMSQTVQADRHRDRRACRRRRRPGARRDPVHPRHPRPGLGGAGHRRPAADPGQRRRRRPAHRPPLRGRRLLLLTAK